MHLLVLCNFFMCKELRFSLTGNKITTIIIIIIIIIIIMIIIIITKDSSLFTVVFAE